MAAEGDARLSRPSLPVPPAGTVAAVAVAGITTGLVLAVAVQAAGAMAAFFPAAALAAVLLLRFPVVAMSLLLGITFLIEEENPGILPPIDAIDNVVFAGLTVTDILLLLGLAGFLLRFASDRESARPRLPSPLTAPLALLGIAVLAGAVVGYYSSAGTAPSELVHRAMTVAYLIAIPLLIVNVVRDRRALVALVGFVAVIAAFKAVSGLYASLGALGSPLDDDSISYLNPVPNLLMLLLVLGVAAAIVRRVELPGWVYAAAPLALFALVLSYRRSFWIAAAFTLVIVVVLASRHRGRTMIAVTAVAVALTLGATALVGSSDPSGNPLATRAKTITPSGFGSNRGDRYRIDERRNAIETLRESPLTGIGLGVPWTAHQPLAESHDRRYVHFAILWFWLSFGLLGVAAYLAVLGAGLWAALTVWRGHTDARVRIGALACFGGLLGLLVAELTATFTGVEPRASVLIGAILGWIAAAWADLPANRQLQSPPGARSA